MLPLVQLWRFLRRTGQMDSFYHRRWETAKPADLYASDEEWIRLDRVLTGHQASTVAEAIQHFVQWRAEMSRTQAERQLIREIHAYWLRDLLTVDDLYHQLYEQDLHGNYASLPRVDKARFARLCETIDLLYAVYNGDLDQLAAFVGAADSLVDFERKAAAVIAETDRSVLLAWRDQMWREKEEWRATAARLAREVLGPSKSLNFTDDRRRVRENSHNALQPQISTAFQIDDYSPCDLGLLVSEYAQQRRLLPEGKYLSRTKQTSESDCGVPEGDPHQP